MTTATGLARPTGVGDILTPPTGKASRAVYVACILLVIGTVSWRKATYYAGGVDSVVVAKAFVTASALIFAAYANRGRRSRLVPDYGVLWLLLLYVLVTTLGGFAANAGFATVVLSVRLILTAAVLIVLASGHEPLEVLEALVSSMVVVALIAAATGVGSISSGRLEGGIPPLSPNDIALLCGLGLIVAVWRCSARIQRPYDAVSIPILVGIIYATGSRTGLLVLAVAMLALLAQVKRMPVPMFTVLAAVTPVVIWTVLSTSIASNFVDRGGSQNVTTLSSRTIAWSAALHVGDGNVWQRWFGGGLSLKQITVAGQFWSQQGLDSTWISALVQGGYFGVLILAVWAIRSVVRAAASPRRLRILWLAMLIFLIGRSSLESGMLDSAPAFLAFFFISLAVGKPARAVPALH
jgi:hypothetical protein